MLPFTNKPARLQAPDSDLRTCKALIIDTNQTSRSILRSMLADLGLTGIIQASKMAEARRALEHAPLMWCCVITTSMTVA